MFARLLSGAVLGIEARLIDVQCDVAGGLPGFHIVGLPDKEVSESRERIRSAVKNSGYAFPARRITANLAPADLRKEGVGFDLPIAIAILIASGQLSPSRGRYLLIGELALDGGVRGVPGVLPIALRTQSVEVDGMIVPRENAGEAALADGLSVHPVTRLAEAVDHLSGRAEIPRATADRERLLEDGMRTVLSDLADVRGQVQAKRALEISAAGGHNLLMVGPPGAGKSLLARCLPDLLPPMSFEEALETSRVYSIAGRLERGCPLIVRRPFRSPHHTISYAGMVGGGHGIPGPGEITLAHHGVLFLDELPEFDRRVLETLRQPLEDRAILLSRAGVSVRYPASFTLVAAMNPCPCGYLGDSAQGCVCAPHDLRRYRQRLSGPFLDRIDLFVDVPRLPVDDLMDSRRGEASTAVRARVIEARRVQWERMSREAGKYCNAQLDGRQLERHCALSRDARELLKRAVRRFALSARAHGRVLRVARTLADLERADRISSAHVAEAMQYRAAGEDLGE